MGTRYEKPLPYGHAPGLVGVLPQGAPTGPMLSNLAATDLDDKLSAFAHANAAGFVALKKRDDASELDLYSPEVVKAAVETLVKSGDSAKAERLLSDPRAAEAYRYATAYGVKSRHDLRREREATGPVHKAERHPDIELFLALVEGLVQKSGGKLDPADAPVEVAKRFPAAYLRHSAAIVEGKG